MQLLIGATLLDGTGAPPLQHASVLLDAGRIAAIWPGHETPPPEGAEILDLSGFTLMPGLIDGHDHLASHSYALAHRWGLDEPASTKHLRTARVLKQTLESGYTSVRDAAGLDVGFKLALDEGLLPGPRVQIAVSIISPTGGIGDRVSPSGHDCCLVLDPTLPLSVANGVKEVRAVVRAMVRAGADVIKCATTGGASSRPGHGPKDTAFSLEEMRTLVEEAHALGRRVMCHALGGPGLRLALEAGVDSIEHGCYLDEDPELLAMMAERGVFFVPTLTVYAFHRDSPSAHVRERARELQAHHHASLHQAHALGVKIVAGTDAGGHQHGINARELREMVDAGLPPMLAIQSATGWAAECLGWDVGTIQQGKLADLIVVEGNPLDNIRVLEDPQRMKVVFKDGNIVVDRR